MADKDSICIVASEKGGMVCGAIPTEADDEMGTDARECAKIPALSHKQVKQLSKRHRLFRPA